MEKKNAGKKSASKIQLSMGPLSPEKIKEIQACLKNGQLKIQVSEKQSARPGKLSAAWDYD